MKYANKSAVISGGSTGIGFGVAKALVGHGARVLITGRDERALEAARRELGESRRSAWRRSSPTAERSSSPPRSPTRWAIRG